MEISKELLRTVLNVANQIRSIDEVKENSFNYTMQVGDYLNKHNMNFEEKYD